VAFGCLVEFGWGIIVFAVLRGLILGALILIENALRVEARDAQFVGSRWKHRGHEKENREDSFHGKREAAPNFEIGHSYIA
jgi:hypothetical protein